MTNTNTLYYKNLIDTDSENGWWKDKILKPISLWSELLESKTIIKGGAYYPRLADTNKRGLNAFNEVHKKYFKEIKKEFLLCLCKFTIFPQVSIDTLIITFHGNSHALTDYLHKYDLTVGDTPFNAIVNDLNIMSSEDKLKQIKIMIENLEFTPFDYVCLIKECSLVLSEFHK